MRALLLISFLGVLDGYHMSAEEACLFVGARFVRAYSSCDQGVCKGLARLETGEFSLRTENSTALSCSAAVDAVKDFLSESGEPVWRSKRNQRGTGDEAELLRILSDDVVPLLKWLAFGSDPLSDDLHVRLAAFDNRARVLAATGPTKWRELTVPALLDSNTLRDMARLFANIVTILWRTPLMHSAFRKSLCTSVHFYFDMAALLGRHFIHPRVRSKAAIVLLKSVPRFRPVDRRELYKPLAWEGVPSDGLTAVGIAEAVARLADPREPFVESEFAWLFYLFAGWSNSAASTTKALLDEDIKTQLCPQLNILVIKASFAMKTSPVVGMVISSLVEFCGPAIPTRDRMIAFLNCRQYLSVGAVPFPRSAGVSAVAYLQDNQTMWYSRFPQAVSAGDQRAIVSQLMSEFVNSQVVWFPKDAFQIPQVNAARAFGRVLGLAIVHGVVIDHLRLDRRVAELLHPRFRLASLGPSHASTDLSAMSTEDLLSVSAGLEETLGLGGFEAFTDSDWLAIFGHTV